MAYSLGARFAPLPKYFTLLDPGAYQTDKSAIKQNDAPFLSRTPRTTDAGAKIWTQAVYKQHDSHKIPNCTAMLSKQPRFPYNAFSAEDLEEMLCKCGILSSCECPTGKEKEKEVICQGKVRRCVYKGPTPRSILGDEGLSSPSRKDHGFNVLSDGYQKRIRKEEKEECPPFYDARVNEATAFYRGCKWSQRTLKRSQDPPAGMPGPGDYDIERGPTKEEICAENVRALKRKTTRQLRFIEMVQLKNILEDQPGPAHYSPMLPKGTDLKFTGTTAKRFLSSKYDISPGPQDYRIRRDFELTDPPTYLCHASLPKPAAFGTKARRFKHQYEQGPSPATYDINCNLGNFVHCPTAPFGTSARRFKKEMMEETDEDDLWDSERITDNNDIIAEEICVKPTWEFKSKTVRMKPLVKKNNEPSPADLAQKSIHIERFPQLQYNAPFFSSEGRFQPWYNWIPIHSILKTPGPAQYCPEKPKCPPAVVSGPQSRAERFPQSRYKSPAPNTYKINDGIETILATHNRRLKKNVIKKQFKFQWEQPKEQKCLSYEEQESILFAKCLSLLDPADEEKEAKKPVKTKVSKTVVEEKNKPKMLRTFLYAKPLEVVI